MSPPGGLNRELQLSVNNRNPDIVIFAFVSAETSVDVFPSAQRFISSQKRHKNVGFIQPGDHEKGGTAASF